MENSESNAVPQESEPLATREQSESNGRRMPTPGGMYRRAEMRAHAESMAVAGAIADAPVELATDVPVASAPAVRPVLGRIDPVVQALAPVADTSAHIPGHSPTPRVIPAPRRTTSIRRRHAVAAMVVAGLMLLIWWLASTKTSSNPQSSIAAAPPTSTRAHDAAIQQESTPLRTTTPPVATTLPTTQAVEPNLPPPSKPDLALRPVAIDPVLRITSDPPGARVTINGVGWGATPIVIRHLPPGSKRVRVTKDGYVAVERVVSLSDNGATGIQLKLRSAATARPR